MAATLQQARDALKARLVAYFNSQGQQVQAYATVPGSPVAPAVIVEPATGLYHQSFGSSGTEHVLAVHALVVLGDREAAQNTLDQMISESGPLSVVAAIHEDRRLGNVVAYADPIGYRDYGTREMGGAAYLMATIDVRVLCHP